MCGRLGYAITATELAAAYPWLDDPPEVPARYNVAPTDPVVVVDRERAQLVTWGIDGNRGGLFNLRVETALRRGSYQHLLLASRVVVPASHFYEWRRSGTHRLPIAISRSDGAPLNLAGLAGRRDGAPAVTVLTTGPNRDLERLHDRMPVVLSDADAHAWVHQSLTLEQLEAMLRPCPEGFLTLRPASPLVNSVRNDGPELLDPNALPPSYQLDLLD
jgi:putative SOS response-associated peptidase YedK